MANDHSPWDGHSILELLQFAQRFGAIFERPGRISDLKQAVETATHLHLGAAACARLMRRFSASAGGREAASAAKWLKAIQSDLAVVEENVRRALLRAKMRRR